MLGLLCKTVQASVKCAAVKPAVPAGPGIGTDGSKS